MLPALLALAASAAPASGSYGDDLKLAFADGRVTGVFREARRGNGRRDAPQFSCAFALTGAWRGGDGEAAVLTWWPGETAPDTRIPGRLTVRGGQATLKLADDPGGCLMTGEELKAEGYEGALAVRRGWTEVREVRSPRAHLGDAPGERRGRAYLTRGDAVGVVGRASTYVKVLYVDGRRPVEGWLSEAELFPAAP